MKDSFIAEIGYESGPDLATARGLVVPELCVPETDVVLAGVLLTWADILAGPLATQHTMPRISMTNDLTLRLLGRPPVGEVVLRSEVLKSGRTTTLTETWLTAAGADAPFAHVHGTFVASPRPQDVMTPELVNGKRSSRPLQRPLLERLGIRVVAPGVTEVDRRADLLNPAETLQGGVVATLAEVAALSVVASHPAPEGVGRAVVAHELDVRYLRATRVGPARAVARVLHDDGDWRTVEVRVVDAGADDRVTAVVMARCGSIHQLH